VSSTSGETGLCGCVETGGVNAGEEDRESPSCEDAGEMDSAKQKECEGEEKTEKK
jgi:hypothetical protein